MKPEKNKTVTLKYPRNPVFTGFLSLFLLPLSFPAGLFASDSYGVLASLAGEMPAPAPAASAPAAEAGPRFDGLSLTFADNVFSVGAEEDQDNDCLADKVEWRLANAFRPQLVFDSRENALLPGEPLALFQVSTGLRRGHCSVPAEVELKFGFLFNRDGGYATSLLCGDSHQGDNERLTLRAAVSPDGKRFTLIAVNASHEQWPRVPAEWFEGSHPRIYMAAGKHHTYLTRVADGHASTSSAWGCREGLDGKGAAVLVATESDNAPAGWHNVGEADAHPASIFVGDLTRLGFTGENAWGDKPFCGHQLGGCGHKTGPLGSMWNPPGH